jgi:regulator of sirC expression with transglutaminase-like and TPR domain
MAACLGMTTGKPTLIDIGGRILTVRDRRVLLDSDLAAVYGVKTLRLNEQVRRNSSRFPDDFLLRLPSQELAASKIAICDLKARRA